VKHERQLLAESLDEPLSSEEQARLDQWLEADAANLREFIRETHLNYSLHQLARANLVFNKPEEARVIRFPRFAPAVALAAAFAVLGTLLLWYFRARVGSPVIAQITGSALVERAGQSLAVQPGTPILPGDLLHTSSTSTVAITFAPEATTFTLSAATDLRVLSLSRGKRFQLTSGKLEATVARQRAFHPMSIRTPQAEARVLGTELTLSALTNTTRLSVTKGVVRLVRAEDGKSVDVFAGDYTIAAANHTLSALPKTGTILHEFWTNLSKSLPVLSSFDGTAAHLSTANTVEYLTRFEIPPPNEGKSSHRIRGYLHPPVTGDYTFWISGGGYWQFYLSRDDQPRNKVWLATAEDTAPREWSKDTRRQQSSVLTLVAGRMYYLEAVQNPGFNRHHLAVAWQGPGRSQEIISAEFLSAFPGKPKNRGQ
jgi:ferric-dicitrate binding protein FerR (iron transport regulator)